jgi:putative ABC transport system permease protein
MRRPFRFRIGPWQVERAVDEELEFHIETRVQRLIAAGMAPDAARAEAVRQFGDVDAVRDNCVTLDKQKERTMSRAELFDQLREDARYALRALRKARGMSTVAVVTLAIAIAAIATVFSVLNTGFFRPLPYPESDRIVGINATMRGRGGSWNSVPHEVADLVRHDAKSFDRVAAYDGWTARRLTDEQGSATFWMTRVDTALLPLMGASAERGRLFTNAEILTDAPVALISDSLWRTRYGRDEAILGRQVRLDNVAHTIIGVLAQGFRFNNTSDIWVPLTERADTVSAARAEWYWLAARLRPGVSLAQAQSEIRRFGRNLASGKPADYAGLALTVQASIVSRGNLAIYTMAALFALVALCVFLIACSNVGNLLLVRGAERRAEMAVRASLGASGGRLLRQSLSECAILGVVAGVVGAVLSVLLLKLLLATFPTQGFPSWLKFGVDVRVLGFVVLITMAAVVMFGMAPSRYGARVNLADALKASSDVIVADTEVTRRSRRSVIVQISLSLALFVASLFFARSYLFLGKLDRGYDVDHVAMAPLRLDGYTNTESRLVTYARVREILNRDGRIAATALAGDLTQLRAAAGVHVAAPASDSVTTNSGVWLPGHENSATSTLRPFGRRMVVSDEYFRLLGMSIMRGRNFGAEDVAGGQRVAVVSQRLAGALWGAENPLGRALQLGPAGPSFIVVGVVSDVRDPVSGSEGPTAAPWPNVYFSERQARFWPMIYLRPRETMVIGQTAVESALKQVDPDALPGAVTPLTTNGGEAQLVTKIFGLAVGGMALCGTLLALLGIYGVVAYGVTRRTREIGLRIALGARPDQVVTLFTVQAMRFTTVGLGIGVLLAMGLSLFTRMFVWGTSLLDPMPYVVAAIVFMAVALIACWLAARRASRVEPREALRTL